MSIVFYSILQKITVIQIVQIIAAGPRPINKLNNKIGR